MAFLALEQALMVGSKVGLPLIMDALFTTTAAGSLLGRAYNSSNSVPTPAPAPQQPTQSTMRANLIGAGVNPEVVTAIANAPVVPPLTSDPVNNDRRTWEQMDAKRESDLSAEQINELVHGEMGAIAQFFQIDPGIISKIPELSSLVSNAVTRRGPVFSRQLGQELARNMDFVMQTEDRLASLMVEDPAFANSVNQARSDYELKIGGPVPILNFINRLTQSGVSGSRVLRAWRQVNGPRGGNPGTSAVFRRWVLDRILPGAAASAVTYALERVYSTAFPGEENNRVVTVEDIRKELLDSELRQAANDLDIGDEARHVIGSASWYDQLPPLPGSVQWTSNTSSDTGLSVDPYPAPIVPPIMGDIITYPGDAVFTRKLKGDVLSERIDDTRASKRASVVKIPDLELPRRTGLPPQIVVPDAPVSNGLGVRATHGRIKPYFPAIHETARSTDHIGSQTYDTTMAANVPSFVSPTTSSAGGLYGRDSRAYRTPLDSAPNVTGIGFDTQETERRLVEAIGVSDGSMNPPATTTPSASTNPFASDQRSYQSRQDPAFVPIGDMTNPVFSNVGAQQPAKPSAQQPISFPIQ